MEEAFNKEFIQNLCINCHHRVVLDKYYLVDCQGLSALHIRLHEACGGINLSIHY